MNEQLQQALATILGKTVNGIDASVEFMQAELPEVIEQLLTWYATYSALQCIFAIVVFFVMAKIDLRIGKEMKSVGDDEFFVMFYVIMGSVVRLIYLVPFSFISLDWLQIWVAPKIWLIEYAASLAK